MDRRTRVCIWIILLGLANFTAYSILYVFIGGEAIHGSVAYGRDGQAVFHLKNPGQQDVAVSKAVYIYSGIHSISIWPTMGAIMMAMLVLAKERVISSMRSTIIRGRTFITILATVITFMIIIITIWFVLQFATQFNAPSASAAGSATQTAARPWN